MPKTSNERIRRSNACDPENEGLGRDRYVAEPTRHGRGRMTIAGDVKLGARVTIHHPHLVNLYGCSIGDDTKIGTFVEIQKQATIGARCKISSHTFICEGVTIEDDVFVGHGVMFINDRYPRATVDGRP